MIVIIMVASCIVLVGISYLMLDILSGLMVTPKTPVKEIDTEGTLLLRSGEAEIIAMQASGDGRFFAYLEGMEEGGGAVMKVVATDSPDKAVFEREVRGAKLAWLGDSPRVVYEDAGDIFLLDLEVEGEPENLTASPEFDSDPVPSPGGEYILWTVSTPAEAGFGDDFWLMETDSGGKAYLAEARALAVWDEAGSMVISLNDTPVSSQDGSYRYALETAAPGRSGWGYYAECEGDVRFIWWPSRDTLLFVGPVLVKEADVVKGVWSRIEQPEMIKKVASTDGLDYDTSYYSFYPSRRDARLAYVGKKGLECLDYEERAIYRYRDLKARTPLAWNEDANEIYYIGPEGIYKITAAED